MAERPARRRRATLLLVALAGTLAVLACQPADPPATTPGWRRIGGDEFGGADLDGTRWRAYGNTYGDGNHELACLTPRNVLVGGGALRIRARAETETCPNGSVRSYTSGFVGSREVGRYYPLEVRVSVRAKLPHAQGLWPAAWLRHRAGSSVAEVDLLEYFHSTHPGRTSQTLHLDGRRNLWQATAPFEAPTTSPEWHTWTVEITRADADGDGERDDVRFRFLVDGTATGTYVDTQHRWVARADPAATWDLALNLAVGGDWVGDPDGVLGYLRGAGRCAQGGTAPDGCTTTGIRRVDWDDPASTTYEVDQVKVEIPA